MHPQPRRSWLFSLAGALALAACALPVPIIPVPSKVTNYEIGRVQRAAVGEPIFEVVTARRVPQFVVAFDHQPPRWGPLAPSRRLVAGMVFSASSRNADGTFVAYSDEYDPKAGIIVTPEGHALGWLYGNNSQSRKNWTAEPLFRPGAGHVKGAGAFRAQIIYSGLTGTTLRAAYREFVDNLARPAFAQELQYELGQDRVISFKSVRVEILSASNTLIEYRVVDDGGLPWLPAGS